MFSGETRYTEAAKGFMDKLKEEGFREPRIKFIIEKAGANKAKGVELVRNFAAANMDLIFTLGTSITIPVSREIKNVPIVFSLIYDPIAAGIFERPRYVQFHGKRLCGHCSETISNL